MTELFEQHIKKMDRQSSKGNQLKWENDNIWYKADFTGYEGLAEYIVSELLKKSSLKHNEFALYKPLEIKYKNRIYNGVSSESFISGTWQIITLERLFKNEKGISLHECIWKISDIENRLKYIAEEVEKLTGLSDFGKYLNKLLTIDAMFLNEDRHTHNIAVLVNEKGEYDYCPIFDNGACLLSDTAMDYPLEVDVYKLIDSVKSKTVSTNFEEQLIASEKLFGQNIEFSFTKKDIDRLLGLDGSDSFIYSHEIRERVRIVLFEQMSRYPYLFKD